jgi:histidine ammonia-lyase
MKFTIDPEKKITLNEIKLILKQSVQLALSDSAVKRIKTCREFLDNKISNSESPIYGINTGFGSLCNVEISKEELENLQINLVKSHACGVGDEVPIEIVRLMLFLKIQAFSYGNSGVSVELVDRLVFFFNEGIYPVIFDQGSLGASGDLAPLAHLSLPLIGEGNVFYKGKKQIAIEILKQLGLQPIKLKSKEGLALLNGTQFMSAYAAWICIESEKIYNAANIVAAISIEAFDARLDPFHQLLHNIRSHQGQIDTADFFVKYLEGSEIVNSPKTHVQDPYSFRCIPQVHGASWDAIQYFRNVIETEINSVTDNPTIFPEEDLILSGGNFHGQPLALALDFVAIALSELASISERRIYLLISGQRTLPCFLIENSGLNSGFMITQYTAASIVSLNKQLCTPSSVDSIVSSNGQEDHVSMGANAATKCKKIVENVWRVLGIECLDAAQALDFRRPKKSSQKIEFFHSQFRKIVPHITSDKYLHPYIQESIKFLQTENL